MEIKIFFIWVIVSFLICVAVVAYAAYKGEDWKVAAIFMGVGFFIAVGQLAAGIK